MDSFLQRGREIPAADQPLTLAGGSALAAGTITLPAHPGEARKEAP